MKYNGCIRFFVDQFPLDRLLVMQADLRHRDHMKDMVAFVKNGGFWTQKYLEEYSKEMKLPRVTNSCHQTWKNLPNLGIKSCQIHDFTLGNSGSAL